MMELVFEPDLLSPVSILYYTILSLVLSSRPIPKLLSNRQRYFSSPFTDLSSRESLGPRIPRESSQ